MQKISNLLIIPLIKSTINGVDYAISSQILQDRLLNLFRNINQWILLSEWGGLNLFDLATIIEAKNFIAHAAYQSYLTDLWMGQLKPTIHAGRVYLINICFVNSKL